MQSDREIEQKRKGERSLFNNAPPPFFSLEEEVSRSSEIEQLSPLMLFFSFSLFLSFSAFSPLSLRCNQCSPPSARERPVS
jgi:hypothetical protein